MKTPDTESNFLKAHENYLAARENVHKNHSLENEERLNDADSEFVSAACALATRLNEENRIKMKTETENQFPMSKTGIEHTTLMTDSINFVKLDFDEIEVHIYDDEDIHIYPCEAKPEWHIETNALFFRQVLKAIELLDNDLS